MPGFNEAPSPTPASFDGAKDAGVSDILDLDARALQTAIRARRVSAREVMTAALDQIERFNERFNAIVALRDREALMTEAGRLDEAAARGVFAGPLHGFPMAPKDLLAVQGLRSTMGSPLYSDLEPLEDSPPAARLRRAGAVFIGKTNTPEFGLGSHTFNPVYGPTLNAYDPSRSAGGSSGGAAAALALRMLPLADGSDFGGSLRNPAGWNNVFGFRPSFGVTLSASEDAWTAAMGVIGPMARTAADLALLLAVQAGFDARAPLLDSAPGDRFLHVAAESTAGRRIGWLGDFGGAAPCDPGVLTVCEDALRVFEDLGCVVEPAAPDASADAAWDAFVQLRWWLTGSALQRDYDDPVRRRDMKPEARWEVEGGRGLSAFDVARASKARTLWSLAVDRLFDRFDYLAAPTAQVFAFPAQERWPQTVGGRTMATYHEWMKGVCLVTLSGCPSLAVPAGFSPAGLSMGLQLIAPARGDRDCLSLALAYDAATTWPRRRPPPVLAA